MKKIWQKSLASMVSAALCLTAFVGCLTVNAAEYAGTISSAGTTVSETATEAKVTLTLSSPDAAMNIAAIAATTDFGTLTAVEAKGDNCKIDETKDLANGRFYVDAIDNVKGFNTADVILTFTKAEKVAVGNHPVTITYFAKESAATWNEDIVNLTVSGDINITVTSATTKPVVDASVRFATDILIKEKAAIRLRLLKSTFTAAGYSDYNITVDYGYYDVNNNLSKAFDTKTYYSSDFKPLNSGVDYFVLACQAMYEINLPLKVTANYLDANGEVVAYNVLLDTTLKDLLVAKMPTWVADSNQQATCTQGVDLVNYATALQNNFAEDGSDLAAAEKINVGFEDYQATYASTQTDFTYNTTFTRDMSAAVKVAVDYIPGASNDIRFRLLPGTIGLDRITMDVTYTSGYQNEVITVSGISGTSLELVNTGVYAYTFTQLALYDLNKTVTATIYVDGSKINTVEYCLEHYIYNHLDPNGLNYSGTSDLEKAALVAAMRFAASTRSANGIAN